jgi:hypothetical protein
MANPFLQGQGIPRTTADHLVAGHKGSVATGGCRWGWADGASVLPAAMVQPVGPGAGRALYDSVVMRQFVGIDLGREPVPDATRVCRFRHLLEEHGLGGEILQTVNLYLHSR